MCHRTVSSQVGVDICALTLLMPCRAQARCQRIWPKTFENRPFFASVNTDSESPMSSLVDRGPFAVNGSFTVDVVGDFAIYHAGRGQVRPTSYWPSSSSILGC